MKKIFLLLLFFCSLKISAQIIYTPNINLAQPPAQYPNWAGLINNNWSILDIVIGNLQASSSSGCVGSQSISATTGTINTTHGHACTGSFVSQSTAITVVIIPGTTNATGWRCFATDLTSGANLIMQTSFTTTTCTISGGTVVGDLITWDVKPI